MGKTKYTKELLGPIVKKSETYLEVVKSLGLQNSSGNNTYIRKVIKKFNLDTSHFIKNNGSRGKKYQTSDYLTNKRSIHSSRLREKLIQEGYFTRCCSMCGLTEWLNSPISLELHHKDGNHENNHLDNLSILCPNCHAFSHALARGCHKQKPNKPKRKRKCLMCKAPSVNKFCSQKCYQLSNRVAVRPPKKQLEKELEQSNFTQVAKKYGVSDNAIRKWLRS